MVVKMEISLGKDIDIKKLLSNSRLRYAYGSMSCTVELLNDENNSIRIRRSESAINVEDAIVTVSDTGAVRFLGTHSVVREKCNYSVVYNTDGVIVAATITLNTNKISFTNIGPEMAIIEEGGLNVSSNEDYRTAFREIVQYERKKLVDIVELLGRLYLSVKHS